MKPPPLVEAGLELVLTGEILLLRKIAVDDLNQQRPARFERAALVPQLPQRFRHAMHERQLGLPVLASVPRFAALLLARPGQAHRDEVIGRNPVVDFLFQPSRVDHLPDRIEIIIIANVIPEEPEAVPEELRLQRLVVRARASAIVFCHHFLLSLTHILSERKDFGQPKPSNDRKLRRFANCRTSRSTYVLK